MAVPVRGVVAVDPRHVVAATVVAIVINVIITVLSSFPLEGRCSGGFSQEEGAQACDAKAHAEAWESLGCAKPGSLWAVALRHSAGAGYIREGQDLGRVW